MKWFKHDSNAHGDAKIERVLMKYGADGYALYWYCIELIAGKVTSDNITFELEHDAELLGWKLKIDSLRVTEIMKYMCHLGLFEVSPGTERIACLKLAKRLDERWTRDPDLKEVIRKSHHMSEDSLKTVCRLLPLEENRIEENRDKSIVETSTKLPRCPYVEIQNLYNEKLNMLPRCLELNADRKKKIKARWLNGIGSIEAWSDYFDLIASSRFLTGRTEKPFRPNIDWILKPANAIKIKEGNYTDSTKNSDPLKGYA